MPENRIWGRGFLLQTLVWPGISLALRSGLVEHPAERQGLLPGSRDRIAGVICGRTPTAFTAAGLTASRSGCRTY